MYKIEIGTRVRYDGNPFDEQYGDIADQSLELTVVAVKNVSNMLGTTGWWVKVCGDIAHQDWIDWYWFTKIK